MDKMYELAIRVGDIAYIDEVLSTEGHIDIPLLHMDPYYILDHANHEVLLILDDYIELPDIVRAMIYDDPIYIEGYPLTYDILTRIVKYERDELYRYYKDAIDMM